MLLGRAGGPALGDKKPGLQPVLFSSLFRRFFDEGFSEVFRMFSKVFGGFRGLLEVLGGPRRLPEAPQWTPEIFDLR